MEQESQTSHFVFQESENMKHFNEMIEKIKILQVENERLKREIMSLLFDFIQI